MTYYQLRAIQPDTKRTAPGGHHDLQSVHRIDDEATAFPRVPSTSFETTENESTGGTDLGDSDFQQPLPSISAAIPSPVAPLPSLESFTFGQQRPSDRYGNRLEPLLLLITFADATGKPLVRSAIGIEIDAAAESLSYQNDLSTISIEWRGIARLSFASAHIADEFLRTLSSRQIKTNFLLVNTYFTQVDESLPYTPIWKDGGFTPAFNVLGNQLARFRLHFTNERTARSALQELDTIVRENSLVGKVGVNLRELEEGLVVLTCYTSEMLPFGQLPGLDRIICPHRKLFV